MLAASPTPVIELNISRVMAVKDGGGRQGGGPNEQLEVCCHGRRQAMPVHIHSTNAGDDRRGAVVRTVYSRLDSGRVDGCGGGRGIKSRPYRSGRCTGWGS